MKYVFVVQGKKAVPEQVSKPKRSAIEVQHALEVLRTEYEFNKGVLEQELAKAQRTEQSQH